MPHLGQSECQRPIRVYGERGDPSRIRLHTAWNVNRHHRLACRVDLLDQPQNRFPQLPMRTGSKNAVHNGICKAEGNAQAIPVAVTHKEADLHAHGTQGIVHRACSCPETLRLTREEEFYARPHIHEVPCRSKGISTIVAATGKDNKHLVLRSADHCRSLFRRPPPCILH